MIPYFVFSSEFCKILCMFVVLKKKNAQIMKVKLVSKRVVYKLFL